MPRGDRPRLLRVAYDAARLILSGLIARLEVTGNPVAVLPHRDWLFICGSDDDDGLQHMAERARPLLGENDRRITRQAFQLRDDRWTPFEPPPTAPAATPCVCSPASPTP